MPHCVPRVGPPPGEPADFASVSSAFDAAVFESPPAARLGLRASIRPAGRRALRALAGMAFAALMAACTHDDGHWQLTDVTGHLPDLAFTLTADTGQSVTASAFRGETTLVYFGYTHCPDVCPETMARLMQVLEKLPAADAKQVRILFISVDPARDTPQALHAYVTAFDAQHIRGLTGTDAQVESLAKRYRVAYQMEKRDPNGSYEVTHSSAVYIFDRDGRARLLATSGDSPDAIAHDLQRVIERGA
jgi:protein SCO1/2